MTLKDEQEEAKRLGLKRFVPSLPCKRGHYLRYTAGRICVECRVFRYAHLTPEQKAKTSERSRQRRVNRSEEKRLKDNATHLAWQRRNLEKVSKWVRDWQKRNPDKMLMIHLRHREKQTKKD